jgi:hypothetical protein
MIDFSGLKDLFGQQSFPFGAPAAMAPSAPAAPAQASGTWGQPPVPGAPPPPPAPPPLVMASLDGPGSNAGGAPPPAPGVPPQAPLYPDRDPHMNPAFNTPNPLAVPPITATAPNSAYPDRNPHMDPAFNTPNPAATPALTPPAAAAPAPASAAAPNGFQKLMNDPEFGKSIGELIKASGAGKHAPMAPMPAPGGGGGGTNPGARQGAAELFQAILQSRAPHPPGGVPQFSPRRF